MRNTVSALLLAATISSHLILSHTTSSSTSRQRELPAELKARDPRVQVPDLTLPPDLPISTFTTRLSGLDSLNRTVETNPSTDDSTLYGLSLDESTTSTPSPASSDSKSGPPSALSPSHSPLPPLLQPPFPSLSSSSPVLPVSPSPLSSLPPPPPLPSREDAIFSSGPVRLDASPVSKVEPKSASTTAPEAIFQKDDALPMQSASRLWNSSTTVDTRGGIPTWGYSGAIHLKNGTEGVTPSPTTLVSVLPSTMTTDSGTPGEPTYRGCFKTLGPGATIISVVHTATLTWEGDPAEYTPEHPPLSVPTPCISSANNIIASALPCEKDEKCAPQDDPQNELQGGLLNDPNEAAAGAAPAPPIKADHPFTYTFYTTDKNPAVVFPDGSTTAGEPDYGGTNTHLDINAPRVTATQNSLDGQDQPGYDDVGGVARPELNDDGGFEAQSARNAPKTNVVIEDRPTEVVIGTSTVVNDPILSETEVITVGTDIFTVGPTEIIGVGTTIERQPKTPLPPPPAITTTLEGVEIILSESVAMLDGSTIAIPTEEAITVTVDDHVVTIAPEGVELDGVTIPRASGPAAPTRVVVVGGELITAVGSDVAVVDGTTYEYGPGIEAITEMVDDEKVVIGPLGVTVDGTTFGGQGAKSGEITFQVVGGATVSEVGASVVEIDGISFTIGPGTGTTVTEIGGEVITIAPDGVTMHGDGEEDGMTLSYPFGPTMTTTLKPGNTFTAVQATATEDSDGDEDGAAGTRPSWVIASCIAIGVGFFLGFDFTLT